MGEGEVGWRRRLFKLGLGKSIKGKFIQCRRALLSGALISTLYICMSFVNFITGLHKYVAEKSVVAMPLSTE